MNNSNTPRTTNPLQPDRQAGQTPDDRATFYWELEELREHEEKRKLPVPVVIS